MDEQNMSPTVPYYPKEHKPDPVQPPAWKIILFVLGATTGIVTIFHILPIFFTAEGTGRVIDRINVKNSGYKAVLDSGHKVHFPPSDLWDLIKVGDFLEKHRFSFVYNINGQDHDGLWSITRMILSWSFGPAVYFIVMTPVIFWLNRRDKERLKEQHKGKNSNSESPGGKGDAN
jgi:hypothetical protein